MKPSARVTAQASVEYLGVIMAAALLVLGLVVSDFGPKVRDGIERAVCRVAVECPAGAGEPAGDSAGSPVDLRLTSTEHAELLAADPQDAQQVLDSLSPEELAFLEENDPEGFAAAARARSWAEARELVDRYTAGDLDDFLDFKSSEGDARLDFSDDNCSAPVVGSTGFSFDFTTACERHDFGYRNYKSLGLFDEEKGRVDQRFLADMLGHCVGRGFILRGQCRRWAYVFYAGVAGFGGHCDLPGPAGRLPGPCAPEYG